MEAVSALHVIITRAIKFVQACAQGCDQRLLCCDGGSDPRPSMLVVRVRVRRVLHNTKKSREDEGDADIVKAVTVMH